MTAVSHKQIVLWLCTTTWCGCTPDDDSERSASRWQTNQVRVDANGVRYFVFERGELIDEGLMEARVSRSESPRTDLRTPRGQEAMTVVRAIREYLLSETTNLLKSRGLEHPEVYNSVAYDAAQRGELFCLITMSFNLYDMQFNFNENSVIVSGTKLGMLSHEQLRSGPVSLHGGGAHYWYVNYDLERRQITRFTPGELF